MQPAKELDFERLNSNFKIMSKLTHLTLTIANTCVPWTVLLHNLYQITSIGSDLASAKYIVFMLPSIGLEFESFEHLKSLAPTLDKLYTVGFRSDELTPHLLRRVAQHTIRVLPDWKTERLWKPNFYA